MTDSTNNGHLALGDIVANMLSGGRGSRMGLAMVPLDRALLSSYRLFIVTIPLSVARFGRNLQSKF